MGDAGPGTPGVDPPVGPADAWAAPAGAVVLGIVAALGLAAWAVGTTDPPGRLLVGLAAFAIGSAAVLGGLARPRLEVGPDGLTLRGATGARHWPWGRIDAVRSVRLRRLGLPGAYVEVDARDDDGTERLLVLGRLELGADPVDVADALQHHRARAGRAAGGSVQRDGAQHDGGDENGEDATGDGEPQSRA